MSLGDKNRRVTLELHSHKMAVDRRIQRLKDSDFVKRLWAKDATLWPGGPEKQAEIRDRLGWLDAAKDAAGKVKELQTFFGEVLKSGVTDVVLLGMGGSSLAPEVFQHTFGRPRGFPKLSVLDSTDPEAIRALEENIDLDNTLFIVASKSGSTIETHSLFLYFYERIKQVKGARAGRQFAAVTDPGSGLEKTATELCFRRIFLAPANVGGRYSALTYFGLVPAALIGVELPNLLARAEEWMAECAADIEPSAHPAVLLGAAMGEAALAGCDKLTLVMSPGLTSFSDWIEQLVAESTGKDGKGIVPVAEEPRVSVDHYEDDRLFVFTETASGDTQALDVFREELRRKNHPMITVRLRDRADLGAAFFLWEMATAVAGAVLEIDPFDQPNVAEAKKNAKTFLEKKTAPDQIEELNLRDEKKLEAGLSKLFCGIRRTDYAAFMIYAPSSEKAKGLFSLAREVVVRRHRVATTLGFGPRFLHSTGQLHKGGGNNGVFIQVVYASGDGRAVPTKPYTFEELKQAQALGDFISLKNKGRRVLRVKIDGLWEPGLHRFMDVLGRALGSECRTPS